MNWNEACITLKQVSLMDDNSPILEALNLVFQPSSVTVLLGSSGSGKSILLKATAGLFPISAGQVKYGDQGIYNISQKNFFKIQKKTGFMFQDGALWANMDIYNNLSLPLVVSDPEMPSSLIAGKIQNLLESFDLLSCLNSRPATLSAGETKIISFLRAVITEPDILFLDEPTTFIDHCSSLKLIKKLFELKKEGKTIIMVTHDMNLACSLGDYFVFLDQGKVELYDSVKSCMKSNNPHWKNYLTDTYSETITPVPQDVKP